MEKAATPGILLHAAISRNDWPACKTILDEHRDVAGACKNRCGSTPLMLAADGKCGKNSTRLLEALLEEGNGGAASAAERNRKGKTAADIAQARGALALAVRLRALEASAAADEVFMRCTHCAAKLRPRSKLEFLGDKVSRGEETNPLLQAMFANPEAVAPLASPLFHRVNSCLAFRKEATESMALIDEVQRLRRSWENSAPFPQGMSETTAPYLDWSGWHFIDLCSGASLTGALALHLLSGCAVSAVDIVDSVTLPHFEAAGLTEAGEPPRGRFAYLRSDVHDPALVLALSARIAAHAASEVSGAQHETPIVVIFGMHCCGLLSMRTVEIYEELKANAVLIMPCCLPPKSTLPSPVAQVPPAEDSLDVFATTDQFEQYQRWSEKLRQRVVQGGAHADLKEVAAVLSERRSLITGSRGGGPMP